MQPNVADLEEFYRGALGHAVRAMITRRLDALWPDLTGKDILTLGYGLPYLSKPDTARRLGHAMPARQGVEQWPAHGLIKSLLIDDESLPFADNTFDRILVVHGLEEARRPERLLLDVHRVLAPQGRAIIVAPNRAGLWAHREASPFGHGRSFSRGQLRRLMRQSGLQTNAWARALYAPPGWFISSMASMRAWEQAGERLWPAFGGVVMVEASKYVLAHPPAASPLFIPAIRNVN